MRVLNGLEPANIFGFFEDICAIPHGSGNTDQLSDWLVAFAKERGLEHVQDELGNVIIIREATPGYEAADAVILQGHMDMVCNKEDGCTKDLAKDGLDLLVDGDLISADGTTLGGDDGVAVAFMLAVLDDDSLQHPRVECVFTVEEETGLYGAEGIDVSPLKGTRFINIDSEDEGILTVGCAGGVTAIATLPVVRETCDGEPCDGDSCGRRVFEIRLSGFLGGHSGTEIIRGQENAIRVLGRLLYELQKHADARLVSVDGGVADNVIPVSASAVIVSPQGDKVRQLCDEYAAIFAHEFKVDPDFRMEVAEIGSGSDGCCDEARADGCCDGTGADGCCDGAGNEASKAAWLPMDVVSGQRVIAYLIGTPNGIEKMTLGIDKLPQTSLSLGVLRTGESSVEYVFCIRSSVDTEREMLVSRLESQLEVLGGQMRTEGSYPGWEYSPVSPLRDLVCQVYKDQTGKDMIIEAIHAGLECGFFAGKMPGLDCISIGPDVRDVHTPDETLHISSVQRTWELVREVLARMKA